MCQSTQGSSRDNSAALQQISQQPLDGCWWTTGREQPGTKQEDGVIELQIQSHREPRQQSPRGHVQEMLTFTTRPPTGATRATSDNL